MITIALGVVAVALFYHFLIKPQLYWYLSGVKQGFPVPVLGDYWKFFLRLETHNDLVHRVYNRGADCRYVGTYFTLLPSLVIRDPDLIRQVTVKDFDHFVNRRSVIEPNDTSILTKSLFLLKETEWREVRPMISPTFTTSKMKGMFELMSQCSQQLVDFYLQKEEDLIEVEMKDIFSRYSNDIIANCVFGISVDSFRDPNNPFYFNVLHLTSNEGVSRITKYLLHTMCPKLCHLLNVRMHAQIFQDFFIDVVKSTIKCREENKIVRPDMLHLMLESRKGKLQYEEDFNTSKLTGFATVEESNIGKNRNNKRNYVLTDKDIASQMATFFFAGFDNVANISMFMAYHLGLEPEIQERLQKEIDELRAKKGKIEYEDLVKLEYLDMVLCETLRLHGTMFFDRICTKPYVIEPKTPNEKPVHIKVGQRLMFPVVAIHHNPEIYPNPERFDPERFSKENKETINPYSYLPFGVGPRNCIGSRFTLIELKILFYYLLSHFTIKVTSKTKIPYKVAKLTVFMRVEGGMWMGLEKRTPKK